MDLRDLVLYIHLGALFIAACGVLVADKVGFAWLLGKTETVSERTIYRLHNVMSFALTVLILSGLYLFWPSRTYLLHQNLFILKMFFVAALVVNSLVIDKLMIVASKLPYREVSGSGKVVLTLSGAASLICWIGTVTCAWLLFGWLF